MPWAIHVKQLFVHLERAFSGGAQSDQGFRGDLEQADVLGQLVLALVLVEVGDIHALQVVVEVVAGQQPFLQTVPIHDLDEIRVRQSQLEPKRPLRALGHAEGELVALEVNG